MSEERVTTLQEKLTASGYRSWRGDRVARDGEAYVTYERGESASLRVTLYKDGCAGVDAFDSQMSHRWGARFSPDVDDTLIAAFLDAAEKEALT